MTDDRIGTLLRALAFAAARHGTQRRKDVDETAYVNHPIELANVLANEGDVDDLDVLCAAILHDTVEDTATTFEELERHFGMSIASVVAEVTDDEAMSKQARKEHQIEHAPQLSAKAKLVKLADKICNLRDLLAAPPAGWDAERKREYFDWAARVVSGLRGTHPGLEAAFDALHRRRDELI